MAVNYYLPNYCKVVDLIQTTVPSTNQLLKFYEMYKLRVENVLFSWIEIEAEINICLSHNGVNV